MSSNSPDPAPQRKRQGRVVAFMAVWTVFVLIVLWWLMYYGSDKDGQTSWFFPPGDAGPESTAERMRDWFRLVHFNFQRIYPWVLLAPYVAWVGARFALERGRLCLNLPVHVVACFLFIMASHTINERTVNRSARVVIIASRTKIDAQPGTNMVHIEISREGSDQLAREALTRFTTQDHNLPSPPEFFYLHRGPSAEAGLTNLLPDTDVGFKGAPFPPDLPTLRPLSILLDLFAYGAIVGLAHSVHFYRRYRERERRALFLESTLAKARLSALQTQLQPHFLFNSLNAIATLLRRDPRLAEAVLMSLSDLLRLTLSQSEKQEVTLCEELQLAQSYLEIQQTRFGDRLRFEKDIQPATLDCLVPTLLFQPLIENAIRHGIEPRENQGVVRLAAQEMDSRLVVTVEDNGVGLHSNHVVTAPEPNALPHATQTAIGWTAAADATPVTSEKAMGKPGTGIGLANLRARLEALYGANHKIEILERNGGGVLVRIEIPWRTVTSATAAIRVET